MVKLGQKLTKHDRRICYRRLSDEGLVTPVDIPSSRILKTCSRYQPPLMQVECRPL